MTRLKADDIAPIAAKLPRYETDLRQRIDCSLLELAVEAAGGGDALQPPLWSKVRAAVVPITTGKGIIAGFSEAVAAIVSHLGLETLMVDHPDVRGLAEAYEGGADLILLADDHRFIAVNTQTRQVVDNAEATGRVFARVLHRLNRDFAHRRCLVLGCGPVGSSAALTLLQLGYRVALCDLRPQRARDLRDRLPPSFTDAVVVESRFQAAIGKYSAILDATPAPGIIGIDDIGLESIVSAPGVPPGVTEAARRKLGKRFHHDPLQSGVASMVTLALTLPVHGRS